MFDESVKMVEREYRNYQPFHPRGRSFGQRGNTGIPHGDNLQSTPDVAARLAEGELWKVEGNSQLDFRYLDREIPLARAKPKPQQDPGALLEVDLFLAAVDRTPILGEVKIKEDQCAFYALIQVLTQAAYAVTPSQRERLVLFGSRPDVVLLEAVPRELAWLDLYVLLIDPPTGKAPYDDLQDAAIELSHKLIADSSLASRIGCIAWVTGGDQPKRGLAFEALAVAASCLRRPRRRRFPL